MLQQTSARHKPQQTLTVDEGDLSLSDQAPHSLQKSQLKPERIVGNEFVGCKVLTTLTGFPYKGTTANYFNEVYSS